MVKTKKLNSTLSKYSKTKSSSKVSDDFEDDEINVASDLEENPDEEEFGDGGFGEGASEGALDENYVGQSVSGHLRSRGLFENIWWKKGALKGFMAWAAIVIIFYIFDFLKMVEVISWQRWGFFLILLLILGAAYEKFFSTRIKI
jgi:hypothetical protein